MPQVGGAASQRQPTPEAGPHTQPGWFDWAATPLEAAEPKGF